MVHEQPLTYSENENHLPSLSKYAGQAKERAEGWKNRAKTRHKVVGIRTWHINLNPAAMSSMAFSKQAIPVSSRRSLDDALLSDGRSPSVRLPSSGPKNPVDWRGPFAAQAGALMVEVTTDKGLKGYGLGGCGEAGALIIDRHMKYFVQERDPLDVEAI